MVFPNRRLLGQPDGQTDHRELLTKPVFALKAHIAHMLLMPVFQRNTVLSVTQWARSRSQLQLSLPLSLSFAAST